MKLSDLSVIAFIQENGIKTEQGIELWFKDHLFLYDIYRDESPKQVIMKAAQVGFSTLAILKSLWWAKTKKQDIIYTLPTMNDVTDFVGGKVNRIIAQNPILQEWCKDKDSVEQKSIDNSRIYYRGTFTEKAALMVTSDLNIYDEEDRSKQSVIQQYSSRLQHSKYKGEWHFSNPSVAGNGVDRYWRLSDQKHWFISCSSCGREQYLSWPDSISRERRTFICKGCGSDLPERDRRVGRWVKKVKEAEYSGYWINLMMSPWVTADEIIRYYETKSIEFFYNFVLGLPYVGEGNTVTPDVIYRNITDKINDQERVVIGCDSGLIKHFVVGNSQGLFYYGKTESWEEIESLLKKFPRSIAVIDALPDLTEPRKLREKYPGRVYLCYFSKDRKSLEFIRWGQGKEWGKVLVDRNHTIQMIVDEFADMRIPLQGTQDDWSDYYSHWGSMYRMTTTDSLGSPQLIWESSNNIDHWVFATVYWRVGMDKFGRADGELIGGITLKVAQAPEIQPDDTVTQSKPYFEFPIGYDH